MSQDVGKLRCRFAQATLYLGESWINKKILKKKHIIKRLFFFNKKQMFSPPNSLWWNIHIFQYISRKEQFTPSKTVWLNCRIDIHILLFLYANMQSFQEFSFNGSRHGCDSMVVGFTTTYAISAYHHWCGEFESQSGRDVQHYE